MTCPSPRVLALLAVVATAGCTQSDTNILTLDPDLAVLPGELDLGEVIIGETGTDTLTVINAGKSDLDITAMTVTDGGDYTLSVSEATIEAGDQVEVEVTLTPTTTGDLSRTLVISSNDPEKPEFEVPFIATAVDVPVCDIALSSTAIDFGVVDPATGLSSFQYVEILNNGKATCTVGSITQTGSGAFTITSPPDIGAPVIIPPEAAQVLAVEYAPWTTAGDSGTIVLESNDPDEPAVELTVEGNGGGVFVYPEADIDCPGVAFPGDELLFDGSASVDPEGETITYIWNLVDVPDGSETTLYDGTLGAPAAPVSETAGLLADLSGEYEVHLRVENESGILSAPAVCRVSVVPENAIHVELVWDEQAADLDLHLAQEGYELFQSPGDVSYCNPNPDWGESGVSSDDPLLDPDAERGPGPENIYLPVPADGDYTVRVHHHTDYGAKDVDATVKIWLEGALFSEKTIELDTNRVWEVGYIRWPEAVFVPYDREPTEHRGSRGCD